jgi:hypothetical protein
MQAIGGFYIGGTPALITGSSTGFCYLIRKSWPQPSAKGDRKTSENQTQPTKNRIDWNHHQVAFQTPIAPVMNLNCPPPEASFD